MFSLVLLFLLIGKCIGHTSGPPYGTCKSFSTGHPSYGINADCTAKVSFLKQGLAVTCYTPGETYTVQVTGSKQFNGILLQADSGILTAVNSNFRKVTNGPCDNAVSHRDKLQTTSVNVSFVAPSSGPAKITLRYTIVFSYSEALENKYSSIAVCAKPTSLPAAAGKTSSILAPSSVPVSKSTRVMTIVPTPAFSGSASTGLMAASSAPMPSPSPSIAVSSPSLSATPTVSSTSVESSTAEKCNSSYYMTDERRKYVSPKDGSTYDCALTELLTQISCEPSCQSATGKRLCCDYGRSTNVTKNFECTDTRSFAKIIVELPVARYVRCVCSVAPSEGSCSRKK